MTLATIFYTIIIYPLVQIIEISFKLFDRLFSNTGIAVLGVSLTVTILCLPLYIVAEKWQQIERDTQARLKRGVDRIKAVFKGDEQYMILTTFYRQNHYHPMMALRSSFGLLIQVPFFMAAYTCLSNMQALQGAHFLFIRDMGKPDALFAIGSFSVNVLPIAMTLINCAAGAVYTKGFPIREKLQIYGMAALFLVLLYNSPSGLVLYWTMNNILSLVKNIFYKLKNPLKVLYVLMCACIVFVAVYVLFVYDGGASMKKRLAAVLPICVLLFVPVILRFVSWLLDKPFIQITCDARRRFTLFAISALSLTLLAGLVLPSEIISSSVQEFSNIGSYTNPRMFLSDSFWQCVGIFLFWPVCIYFLFRERVQAIMAVIFSTGIFTALVNTYAFSGNYGSMDATLKFIGVLYNQSIAFLVTNVLAVIVLTIVLFLLFNFGKEKIISSLIFVTASVLVVLTVLNIAKINREYDEFAKITERMKEGGDADGGNAKSYVHLSKTEKNVIVFMLDRAESSYVEAIMNDQPDVRRAFSGFKFYKNTLAFNGHTLMGVPPVFGGYEYTPAETNKRSDVPLKTKHNEASLLMARVFTEQADFSALLSDTSWGNYSYTADMSFADEYKKIEGISFSGRFTSDFKKEFGDELKSVKGTVSLQENIQRNLLWVSYFREVPAIVRPAVYYKGSWWALDDIDDIDSFFDMFSVLYYLNKMTDLDSQNGNFVMMTNDATHGGADVKFLNLVSAEDMSYKDSTAYDINTYVLWALGRWFDFLRENDVYDNTRIIIVSDHGIGYGALASANYNEAQISGYTKDHLNPVLFFKDFNSNDDFETDMTFMTTADVPTLALSGVIEKPTNPFTGNAIDSSAKQNGMFITIDDIFMPHHSKSENVFTIADDTWYHVRDNIFVDENWTQKVPE